MRARCARGRTVAAVAGGLDLPYPPEHADLQRRIAEARRGGHRGAARHRPAEPPFPPPQPPDRRTVARRAWWSRRRRARGSLITARLALDADRELFAVPGSPLDPRCRGSNDLLRQGAHLVEDASDVLQHLPPEAAPTARPRRAFREPPPERDRAAGRPSHPRRMCTTP